jgi:hypothetical protein
MKLNRTLSAEDLLYHNDFIGLNIHNGGCIYEMGKGYLANKIETNKPLGNNFANCN